MAKDNVMCLSALQSIAGSESLHPCFLMMKSLEEQLNTFQELSHVWGGKWRGHSSGNQHRVSCLIRVGFCNKSDVGWEAEPL